MNNSHYTQILPRNSDPRCDLGAIRARLAGMSGRKYWRCLEEIAETEAFQEILHREFPAGLSEWKDEVSRRHFLKIMGASLALAGLNACTKQPVEKIVPYVKQPAELIPGKALYFATAMILGGFATGVIATSREGRPTKIEGNPDHPTSLGATSIFGQASVLELYDPDRAQAILNSGEPSDWAAFLYAVSQEMRAQREKQGSGLRVLTETVTSPTLSSQLQELLVNYPLARWHQWDPLTRDNVREGARVAFGEILETHYHLDKADVILALDSDFLFSHPASLLYARKFADRRRVKQEGSSTMNRLYVVEPTPTITGAMADHRLPLAAAEIEGLADALIRRIRAIGEPGDTTQSEWIAAVANDLKEHQGSSIVIAGEQQPPRVHALVHEMNQLLGNVDKTITYTSPVEPVPVNQLESLRQLVGEMKSGAVDMLVIIGGNPVFDAPADVDFSAGLQKLRMCVRLGLYENETSRICHWHIPEAHYLESWSDARAFDGTVSIIQPLIEPLYSGKTPHELIDGLLQRPSRQPYDIVREYWKSQNRSPDFEKFWRKALSDGVIANTKLATRSVTLSTVSTGSENLPKPLVQGQSDTQQLELIFRPDATIWDGRFINNGWLQELAKPITKLTWDNAALISPKFAERQHLRNGALVELSFRERALRVPVWIVPGQADNVVTVHVGYGRERTGRIGSGTGFNPYALRTCDALWFGDGFEINKTGATYALASTQKHHSIEGRDIIREGTLEEFLSNPHFINVQWKPLPADEETLYDPDEFKYTGYKWGMSIDLNTCIGCNACVIACQAENNIPVVGKDQVARGREMQWIRVDSYFRGSLDNPAITHQPVPCMHCENAPCEPVCPVGATLHDAEGLNVQVYNRCIGTRYCSNNCPYKVRRFNFYELNAGMTPVEKMVKNPAVTVRSRGVMEKCTYCTQRINAVRITAEQQDRKIRDGEIITACQAACPAEAIIFGDLNDPNSRVSRLKAQALDYCLLGTLNTRPRTSYLAKLRNPNPELKT
jgi:MoCo/4Fe-4S cofactor protein with predicted Tat translocation signal